MKELVAEMVSFLRNENGVTAIEYGLLAALIALAIVVGAGTLGNSVDAMFTSIGSRFIAV